MDLLASWPTDLDAHHDDPTDSTMEVQHTITKSVSLSGRGLFTGEPVNMTFRSAPANHGIVFVRRDLDNAKIPAAIRNVVKRDRRTSLREGDATIDTCEHCMSALAGLQIDNIVIEMDASELPGVDGSVKPYVDVLLNAGIKSQDAPRRRLVVTEPVIVRENDSMIAAMPNEGSGMQVVYDLDYGLGAVINRQVKVFDFPNADFAQQIAPARTYATETESQAMRAAGLGEHLTFKDVLVIGDSGPLGGNSLRFEDEPVRHKIADLIGDMYLLGAPIQGRILARKSGHAMNHALVRELIKQFQKQVHRDMTLHRTAMDVRRLTRILPHRYPMLLVDRVIEIDGDRRALGVKNVTINEPFFQGHYPGTPIMPGVLIVEAMAQLSGVLIAQKLEHTGKLAVLLSLDKVKLRRPVTPGDQLILEAESIRIRSRIAHMRCRAFVGDQIAAEAEVKFMLVDDEQESH